VAFLALLIACCSSSLPATRASCTNICVLRTRSVTVSTEVTRSRLWQETRARLRRDDSGVPLLGR
jgi:hypothetical protein